MRARIKWSRVVVEKPRVERVVHEKVACVKTSCETRMWQFDVCLIKKRIDGLCGQFDDVREENEISREDAGVRTRIVYEGSRTDEGDRKSR